MVNFALALSLAACRSEPVPRTAPVVDLPAGGAVTTMTAAYGQPISAAHTDTPTLPHPWRHRPGTALALAALALLFAAVVLEQHRYPPLVLSFESIDLLDHVIFVYRTSTGWGSVARSRDPGLHGRRPLFATPRALALSYFESYIDFTGRIKAYAVVDLRVMGAYDWRLSTKSVWKVEQMLLDWPHRKIASSDRKADSMRRRYRAFREAHGYKPWKYYKGRDRWMPLPEEFARRG